MDLLDFFLDYFTDASHCIPCALVGMGVDRCSDGSAEGFHSAG